MQRGHDIHRATILGGDCRDPMCSSLVQHTDAYEDAARRLTVVLKRMCIKSESLCSLHAGASCTGGTKPERRRQQFSITKLTDVHNCRGQVIGRAHD